MRGKPMVAQSIYDPISTSSSSERLFALAMIERSQAGTDPREIAYVRIGVARIEQGLCQWNKGLYSYSYSMMGCNAYAVACAYVIRAIPIDAIWSLSTQINQCFGKLYAHRWWSISRSSTDAQHMKLRCNSLSLPDHC